MTLFHFDIAPRAALAAPTEPYIIQIQSAVIVAASVLSVFGAGWIIASFFVFPNLRSFRHHLILGLAISDCAMAFNFLVSSSMNVAGRWIGAPEQARFCSFNGFMTQVFVIQTDYWVLIIAVCTYFVLADHKRSSSWVQRHVAFIWALPWTLSALWAAIGLGVTGYGDIGAWCWFTSDEVRLLVNFVPRWTIIGVMALMYARLYLLLFHAHRSLVSSTPSGSGSRQLDAGSSGHAEGGVVSARHTRRLKRLARLMLLYPLAYAVVWTLPTAIRIHQTVTGEAAPWQLQTADKACIVLQGFVDAAIYGATESCLSSWRNLLFPRRFPAVNDIGMGAQLDTLSGKRPSRMWNPPHTADQQLASRSSNGDVTRSGNNDSVGSLAVSSTEETAVEGRDRGGTGSSEGTLPIMGIRKTVEIEISTADETAKAAPQMPLKTYFPTPPRDRNP